MSKYTKNQFLGDAAAALSSGTWGLLSAHRDSYRGRDAARDANLERAKQDAEVNFATIDAMAQGLPDLPPTDSQAIVLRGSGPSLPNESLDDPNSEANRRLFVQRMLGSINHDLDEHERRYPKPEQQDASYKLREMLASGMADHVDNKYVATAYLLGGAAPVNDHWLTSLPITALGRSLGRAVAKRQNSSAGSQALGAMVGALTARTGLRAFDAIRSKLSPEEEKPAQGKGKKGSGK